MIHSNYGNYAKENTEKALNICLYIAIYMGVLDVVFRFLGLTRKKTTTKPKSEKTPKQKQVKTEKLFEKSFFEKPIKQEAKGEKNIEKKEKYGLMYEKQMEVEQEISSLWNILKFNINSQAFYLKECLNFDEWLDIYEIKRRIKENFGIDYKNEKSLYPYIKTMVDVGLLEFSDFNNKRHWRKRVLFLRKR